MSIALDGLDRIIPVRSDDDRIMTCILEYAPGQVTVNDVIHVRAADGWQMNKSSYRKLRLAATELAQDLGAAGFRVSRQDVRNRMTCVVAEKCRS